MQLRRLREKKENVMPIVQLRTFPRILTLKELTLVLVFFMSLLTLPAWPQQHDMSDMEGMPGMNRGEMTTKVGHEPSEALALRLADRHVWVQHFKKIGLPSCIKIAALPGDVSSVTDQIQQRFDALNIPGGPSRAATGVIVVAARSAAQALAAERGRRK